MVKISYNYSVNVVLTLVGEGDDTVVLEGALILCKDDHHEHDLAGIRDDSKGMDIHDYNHIDYVLVQQVNVIVHLLTLPLFLNRACPFSLPLISMYTIYKLFVIVSMTEAGEACSESSPLT